MAQHMKLSAADLDDYLAPAPACTRPAGGQNSAQTGAQSIEEQGTPTVKIELESEQSADVGSKQSGGQTTLGKAKISLEDCLACSGCITSAESVLISMQSDVEVEDVVSTNLQADPQSRRRLVASIAPQCVASVAAFHGLTTGSTFAKLKSFLCDLSFEMLVDSNIGRELSLVSSCDEFVEKWRTQRDKLPVLTSACPGWVCYVEKSQHVLLPHLSTVRSPQALTGAIIKQALAKKYGVPKSKIFHVSIMPCFDKKLEASRGEFADQGVRDVDCVITTLELQRMLERRNVNFIDLHESPVLQFELGKDHKGSSSGGYLAYVLTRSASILFGLHNVDFASEKGVTIRTVRNNDLKEYSVHDSEGNVLLQMAVCYGFRNIQNLVRKLTKKPSGKLKAEHGKAQMYDYVEVMACPSGCINGGGQLKPFQSEAGETVYTAKEWIDYVEKTYHSGDRFEWPTNEGVEMILRAWGVTMEEISPPRAYSAVAITSDEPLMSAAKW